MIERVRLQKARPSLDLAARLIVCASYLYYRHDVSMMSDGEFDDLCQRVARNWDRLDKIRRFQLRSPDDIKSSGFHVRVTKYAEGASLRWMLLNKHEISDAGPIRKWTWSEKHRVHWASIIR